MSLKIHLISVLIMIGASFSVAFAQVVEKNPACIQMQLALSDFENALTELNLVEQNSDKQIISKEILIVKSILGEITAGINYRSCNTELRPHEDGRIVFNNLAADNCPHRANALEMAELGRFRLDAAGEEFDGHRADADALATTMINILHDDIWYDSGCHKK